MKYRSLISACECSLLILQGLLSRFDDKGKLSFNRMYRVTLKLGEIEIIIPHIAHATPTCEFTGEEKISGELKMMPVQKSTCQCLCF